MSMLQPTLLFQRLRALPVAPLVFAAVLAGALGLLPPLTHAAPPAYHGAPAAPAVAPESDEWTTHRPGGETACAVGEYEYYTRSAAPDRLLIHFDGGGACWDAETCAVEGGTYSPQVAAPPEQRSGVFDLDHPDNPVADYSMLVVPYCTGDVHLGDQVATYTTDPEDGEAQTFTIPHRGLINGQTALQWAYDRFEAPEQIVVTGSSAGAVAMPLYADQVARRYPEARVIGLGDAASAYRSDAVEGVDQARWGVPEVMRRYEGWETYRDANAGGIGIEALYATAAQGTPNLELYQFDQAYDEAQQFYLELGETEDPDVLALIQANQADIRRVQDAFRSFIVGGYEHTVLTSPRFYYYEADGYRFRDWVAGILAGEPVPSVQCATCDRPSLRYTEADLALMNRALDLLASEAQWDPAHEGACPAPDAATQRSLICAVVQAAREDGLPAIAYPAISDLYHTIIGRVGPGPASNQFFWDYNNADSTDFADIRAVLTEVRDRVAAALQAQTSGAGD